MDFLKLSWIFFAVFAVLASAEHKTDEVGPDEEHFDHDGHHNPDFDTEAMFGEEEAEKMKHMDDDELKEKISEYVDKIDTNKDNNLDKDELNAWIAASYQEIDKHDIEKHFVDHDNDDNNKLSWNEALKYTYGYDPDELAKLVEEKDEAALNVHKVVHFEQAKFQTADTNKDGALSNKEFYHYAHPQTNKEIGDAEINKTVAQFDKNGDGKLDLDEFMGDTAAHAENPEEVRAAEEANFKEYDINKDGFLDHEEIREWQVPSYESSAKQEVEHLFSMVDEDKDGVLSRKEVLDHSHMFSGTHILRDHDEL